MGWGGEATGKPHTIAARDVREGRTDVEGREGGTDGRDGRQESTGREGGRKTVERQARSNTAWGRSRLAQPASNNTLKGRLSDNDTARGRSRLAQPASSYR